MTDGGRCIQERYAPHNACFGCGPANPKGLRVRSFEAGDGSGLVATWRAAQHHEAFPGVLSGGAIGTLLDCHCNWTAAWHLMKAAGGDHPPCTVTADYKIVMRRPTPTGGDIELRARVRGADERRVEVVGELAADGKVCATCEETFVAVTEGHPAYHRW